MEILGLPSGPWIPILFGLLLVAVYWISRPKEFSQFKVRESDILTRIRSSHVQHLLDQKQQKKTTTEPLQLPGIRIDGAPHEILGLPADATAKEVKLAYRELMKHYHPDSVAQPGTSAWKDAQEIASAINRAKEMMLANLKK